MKIPSIVKLPKYKRFDFQPRYYDAVKERIEQKMAEARRELEAENGNEDIVFEDYGKRIRAGFRKRGHIEKQRADFSQSFFVLGFVGFFVLYFLYGNLAFWLFAVILPFYFWLKLRK
jgi:hypothetical protein